MNPLVRWAGLARRGIVGPAFSEGSIRQGLILQRWGVGLPGQLRQAAARDPERIAVIDEVSGQSISYAGLVARSDRVCKALIGMGIGRGHRVGLLARNHLDLLVATLGASLVAADLVVLNLGLSHNQLRYLAAGQGIIHVFHDDEFAPLVRGMESGCAVMSLPELIARADTQRRHPYDRPPSKAGRLTLMTAGTSGMPRGVPRSYSGVMDNFYAFVEKVDIRAGDVFLLGAPFYTMWGMSALCVALGVRGTVVLQGRFEPGAASEALVRHRVQVFVGVPATLARMVDLPPDPRVREEGALRAVVTSGSRMPSGLVGAVMGRFGDVLYNVYGSTESSVVSIATPDDLRRAPDCVGTAPIGVELAILDDDLQPVPEGATGRIFVRNPMSAAYADGTTRQQHRGLLAIGDLGHIRDGLLFVDGREDDMAVCNGTNVYPVELERALDHHPDVRDVAAMGVPDREAGQRLVAFVVPRDGAEVSVAGLAAYAKRGVSRDAVPREIILVDSLPRNDTGKIVRDGLRDALAARA